MGVLVIDCPIKGGEISTGIEVSPENLRKLPDVRTYTECPHCSLAHGWLLADARLSNIAGLER